MRAPMILPRVAKQAGISEELALKLWRRAASETELLLGESRSPEYYRLAVEHFLSLADEEALCAGVRPDPAMRLTRAWKRQRHMSELSMTAARNTYRQWQQAWQKLYRQRKAA